MAERAALLLVPLLLVLAGCGTPPTVTPAAPAPAAASAGARAPASAWAQSQFQLIGQLHAQERIDEALALAEEVVRREPQAPGAQYTLGVMLGSRLEYERAIEAFEAELAANPAHGPTLKGLATAYEYLERHEDVAEVAARYLELEPGDVAMMRRAGASLADLGRDDEARRYLVPAAAAGDLESMVGLGRVLQRDEDPASQERAETLLRDALAMDPWHPEATLYLGRLLSRTGRAHEGEVLLARHAALAERRDEMDNAERAQRLAPTSPDVLVRLGEVRARHGDLEGAEAAYRQALSFDDAHLPAQLGLADLALRTGESSMALGWAESAAKAAPDNQAARLRLGLARLADGETEAARELLGDLEALPVGELVRLGDAFAAAGLPEEARGAYEAAIEAGSGEAEAWLGRARLALRDGAPREALDALERARDAGAPPRDTALLAALAHATLHETEARDEELAEAAEARLRSAPPDPDAVAEELAGLPGAEALLERYRAALDAVTD